METTILTEEGAARLEEQLEYLKTVARKEVSEQIRVAREFGDISENAEYDEAKNEQARIEGQIVEIEKKLRTARIVKESELDSSCVTIGSRVELTDETGMEYHLQLGGSTEADMSRGIITNESPLGAGLMGKPEGATIEVETPMGIRKFTIHKITQ